MAAAGLELAGLDYITAIADGSLPPPPVAAMLGFAITEAVPGRAVFAMAESSVAMPMAIAMGTNAQRRRWPCKPSNSSWDSVMGPVRVW